MSLDRLSRSKNDIKSELQWFKDNGVRLMILDLPSSMIQVPEGQEWIIEMINNILIEVLSSMAEQERLTMTPEAAAYPKLKKIKTELDSQNAIIFEAEKLRGSLEIEMSNLKGLAKLTRKGDLQRKNDEKTYYINRLKVGLSNMVRNSGFENMNEFLQTFRECRNAYTDYQRQYESWKNACRKPDTPTHKDEKLSDKLARLQREAAENQNSISRQTKNRGAR